MLSFCFSVVLKFQAKDYARNVSSKAENYKLPVRKLNTSRTVGWVLFSQVRASRCVNYSSISATPPDWKNITSSEGLKQGLGASDKLYVLWTQWRLKHNPTSNLELFVSFQYGFGGYYRCTPLYSEIRCFKALCSILQSWTKLLRKLHTWGAFFLNFVADRFFPLPPYPWKQCCWVFKRKPDP